MGKIRFYRQQRYDGGVRTGLGIDDEPVLHDFRAGDAPSDAALLWYVDIALEGRALPNEPEAAREWLLIHREPILASLRSAVERLEIGLDDNADWPYRLKIEGLPRGIHGEVLISGVRRLAEGELAERLNTLVEEWQDALDRLAPLAAA